MTEFLKTRIIKLLSNADYRPLKLPQLAKAMGVNSQDYPQFKSAVQQLYQAGHMVIGTGNLITLPGLSGRIVGRFRANPKGFGFITPLEPNSHGDLFVGPDCTAGAMTGDIVCAKVIRKSTKTGQARYSGKIVEILERAENRFVGTLTTEAAYNSWIVKPDGNAFVEPIAVDDISAKGARHKDKVVVEIISYPTSEFLARGVIIEVLGRAGHYDSEVQSIIRQYRLPQDFPKDCIEQARQANEHFTPDQTSSREDIASEAVITIDPEDAKDFDDAISLRKDARGNWMLGVHIADVNSFVPANSPLDEEAKDRGNSIYLPAKTIPMLPELLSNGICSLQPGQKRFVKSVYLTYDPKGSILHKGFASSTIRSTCRLTYKDADRILKGHIANAPPEVVQLLRDMEKLARLIEKRRIRDGMLELNLPETELIMDNAGRVTDAHPADNSYPHTIIEMFMVEANEAVASLLDRLNVRFMRRIHPEPDILSMKNLAKTAKALGFSMPHNPDRQAIQGLLQAARGTDNSLAINLVVLRSLEKARYSPLNIGHFALASAKYCHFTSPIRRYADLLVHRILDYWLQHGNVDGVQSEQSDQDLSEIGSHITFTEQRAEDAENELKTVLILQVLSNRIGAELDCVVTGVTNFGVFAQSQRFGIEGLIPIDQLDTDQWKYNPNTQSITGQGSGITIRLGQAIKAKITSVNIPSRQLNLSCAKPLVTAKRQTKIHPTHRQSKHRGNKQS